jgi:Hypothetical glycosyl hydrolase family 15
MRNGTRTISAGLAIMMIALVAQVAIPMMGASAAGGTSFTFTGTVSATGDRWVDYPFAVTSAGKIDAVLTWGMPSADLNLFLKDPTGKIVTSDVSTAAPAKVTYQGSVLGTWTSGVKAKSGSSPYNVTVTVGASTSPSPSPSPTPSPSPSPSPPPGDGPSYGGGVPIWDAGFMEDGMWGANTIGATAAQQRARDFDIIAAPWREYQDYVAQMKAANPNLVLYAYQQGLYPSSDPTAFPESFYARDAQGNKIMDKSFNTWLMDPTSQGWRDQLKTTCQTQLADSGYDGCFLDSLGASALNPNSVTGMPIDPRTHTPYTKASWYAAAAGLAQYVRSGIAPHPVIGNGLNCGSSYYLAGGGSGMLLDGLDGGMSEAFVRSAGWSVTTYRNETQWKQDVDMLLDIAKRPAGDGNVAYTVTKVWTTATAAQIDAWHRYALGTFLLGYVPGHAYFTFRDDKGTLQASPYWNVQLGDPVDTYAKVGGVYQRDFELGRVLVNPTTVTVTVALGAPYRNLSGAIVTSVTLAPHTADIFTAVSGA